MLLRNFTIASVLPVTILIAGCAGEPETETSGPSATSLKDSADAENTQTMPGAESITPPPKQSEPESSTASSARPIQLEKVEPGQLDSLVAQHKGKVVLFDFWATWCVPCVQQFPHTVELSKTYSDDLVVYAISMNDVDEETLTEVEEFYSKHGPGNVRTYLSSDGGADEAYEGFEITGGALPHYKVYGRDGNLIKAFGGSVEEPLDPKEIDTTIVDAIAK